MSIEWARVVLIALPVFALVCMCVSMLLYRGSNATCDIYERRCTPYFDLFHNYYSDMGRRRRYRGQHHAEPDWHHNLVFVFFVCIGIFLTSFLVLATILLFPKIALWQKIILIALCVGFAIGTTLTYIIPSDNKNTAHFIGAGSALLCYAAFAVVATWSNTTLFAIAQICLFCMVFAVCFAPMMRLIMICKDYIAWMIRIETLMQRMFTFIMGIQTYIVIYTIGII